MRRILSIVLLVVFVLQATGSASATPPGAQNRTPVGFDLLASIVSTRAFLGSTMIGALATGQMPLYQAMHDTPPDFSLLTRNRQIDLAPLRVTPILRE